MAEAEWDLWGETVIPGMTGRHFTGWLRGVCDFQGRCRASRQRRRRERTVRSVSGRPASVRKRRRKFLTRSSQVSGLQSSRVRMGSS
ncbi:MAG: hypothetical protein RL215_2495 [Planctomycetota bacterium]